jgi:hypothetical protein
MSSGAVGSRPERFQSPSNSIFFASSAPLGDVGGDVEGDNDVDGEPEPDNEDDEEFAEFAECEECEEFEAGDEESKNEDEKLASGVAKFHLLSDFFLTLGLVVVTGRGGNVVSLK